jgi:hypothetical protein
MQWPVNVKELNGTVNNPVTHVNEVEVKRALTKLNSP